MAKTPAWQRFLPQGDGYTPRSYKLPEWSGQCTSCGNDSTVVKFGRGRAGVCNSCYKKEWELNNSLKVRCQRLYGNAQKRAKARGWPPPDFTSEWIEEKILNGVCEVTGIPFDLTTYVSETHAANPWVPSLDRIDSSKPYLKDNVQVVVYMYNVCKGEFSQEDVMLFARMLVRGETDAL
jgi:hypothetical protein